MDVVTHHCFIKLSFLKPAVFLLTAVVLTSCGTVNTTGNRAKSADADDQLNVQDFATTESMSASGLGNSRANKSLGGTPDGATGTMDELNRTHDDVSAGNLALMTTPQVQTDLWQELRNGFSFADALAASSVPSDNRAGKTPQQRVEYYRERLIAAPASIQSIAKNAEPYLYFVVKELKANQIPLEIALLPIVESRYDPFAYSPGRASGLWQFIPATGKSFGLDQDWWQDKRRDTVLATRGAITYLASLHARFNNDWLLALAAYNAGQGNVAKAIRKNEKLGKPTDYWSLDLPQETENYVPKLLAWRDIIKHADQYAIDLRPIANKPHFKLVDIGSQIDLAEAAALADVDIDTIYNLNSSYNRWATDPKAPHLLAVPVENADTLKQGLTGLTKKQRLSWQRYVIQPNDSLIKIGYKFNTSAKLIASVNNIKNSHIRAGKALLIPSAAMDSEFYYLSENQRLSRRQGTSPKNRTRKVVHNVGDGESLWDISRHFEVGVNELARWNSMAPGDVLAINRKIVVWTKEKPLKKAMNEKRTVFYTVRRGDSLAYIADRFKVRLKDIRHWNSDASGQYIQPGQSIKLLVDVTNRRTFN